MEEEGKRQRGERKESERKGKTMSNRESVGAERDLQRVARSGPPKKEGQEEGKRGSRRQG